jgi:hypothetical protein
MLHLVTVVCDPALNSKLLHLVYWYAGTLLLSEEDGHLHFFGLNTVTSLKPWPCHSSPRAMYPPDAAPVASPLLAGLDPGTPTGTPDIILLSPHNQRAVGVPQASTVMVRGCTGRGDNEAGCA